MGRPKSSFNGRIEDIPEIYADNFTNVDKIAYFLSHCHTDHTEGLFGRSLIRGMRKNCAKIFMTVESKKIVKYLANQKGVEDICDYIETLELGTTTVTIGDSLHIEVTLIPAGHCLGSVMFLFRTKNKTILYTGDFRIRTSDLPKYSQLHRNGEPITIDVMYVDTTFLNVDYADFAKRSTSVEEAIEKIDEWLQDPDNRVSLHTSAICGYEYVFSEIYKRLGIKVGVDNDKWELYKQFRNLSKILQSNDVDPQIHLCKNIRYAHQCYHNSRREKFLSVHFSAMSWPNCDEQNTWKERDDTLDVCFATHCSRGELISFVNYFQPARVEGFRDPYVLVSPKKDYGDEFVPSPVKRDEEIPRGRKRKNLWELF